MKVRYPFLDSLRGFAIVIMVIFHFCYDLNYFHLIHQDMNHSIFWLSYRALIMSLFLSLVGMGLVLGGADWQSSAWRKRQLKLAFCAAAVSLGSYLLFSEHWIFFGILHLIFISSLLALFFIRFTWLNFIFGWIFIFLPQFFHSVFFDRLEWQWVGFMTYKPFTEDYCPIFPWFGLVLLGMWAGKWLPKRLSLERWPEWRP
jgi:uncharacterized membrane protein